MRKIKFIIPLLILFLTIGFAAVNFSLSINGDTEITGNLDNFNVYFSRALVNGEDNNSIVSSKTQLDFSGIIDKVGNTYTIEYDVTNASTLFDAEVIVKCSPSSEYLLVQNTFDTSNLSALETRTGTLLLKKLKTISSDSSLYKTITCEIVATPIERESEVTGSVSDPLNPSFIGREVSIGEEKFNVISSTEDTVTMLAKYNLGTNYRQSTSQYWFSFSNSNGWEYTPAPKEIDIQKYDGNVKQYVNTYIEYLSELTNSNSIKGDIMSLNELKNIGCSVPSNYTWSNDESTRTCAGTQYSYFVVNNQYYWLKSTDPTADSLVWVQHKSGDLGGGNYASDTSGIRPTITISIELYTKLISSSSITYKVGREISIGDEKFNVISDNGLTVTMLAKYNLGTDYRQSKTLNRIQFSEFAGWGFDATDINIQNYDDGEVKSYINNYVEYLQTEVGDTSLVGDIISLKQLKELGCTIQDDYSWTGNENCNGSQYKKWIYNGQSTWTRSVYNSSAVWILSTDSLGYIQSEFSESVRPTITIDKETLNYLESLGNYEIGEEISIEEEKFNVISQTATTVTMLAKYNLGTDYRQSITSNGVNFSQTGVWSLESGTNDIDIQSLGDGSVKNYVNNYVDYLISQVNDNTLIGNIITLSELKVLGCTVQEDYSYTGNENCYNSKYKKWLYNGQLWWTRSIYTKTQGHIWVIDANESLDDYVNYDRNYCIRPTITISKETLKYLAS